MLAIRLPCVIILLAVTAGCASTWPHVVAMSEVTAPATRRGEWISTYDEALASIAAIVSNDLGLPTPSASVEFHKDREAFRLALERTGYDPVLARDTAAALSAVSGHRRVIVNDLSMDPQPWPIRIALLAHELTHTIQYDFANGQRGASDQWLREGFAEWVEVEVLVRLGFTTRAQAQRIVISRLQTAGTDALPALSRMVTFPDWVAVIQRSNQEAVYGYAMLATQHLLERVGVDAFTRYFRLFATSDDRLANFQTAFGQSLEEFERGWQTRRAAMMR